MVRGRTGKLTEVGVEVSLQGAAIALLALVSGLVQRRLPILIGGDCVDRASVGAGRIEEQALLQLIFIEFNLFWGQNKHPIRC